MTRFLFLLAFTFSLFACDLSAREPDAVVDLWPEAPPNESGSFEPEVDRTTPEDPLIAGRRVARLTHVTKPSLSLYRAPADQANGAAVIICPGGGFHVLAWDLEGTEVASWLNAIGVTAVVLKYRVPPRPDQERWLAPLTDGQRALSLVRSRADAWAIDPERIGILGFSAGGHLAAMTSTHHDRRQYSRVDAIDEISCRPDFAILIYTGGLITEDASRLRSHLTVDENTPPMFIAHAGDDKVEVENSVLTYLALHKAGVPSELHVYASGGHGFGLRRTDEPCTAWPDRCHDWMAAVGWLKPRS